MEAQKPKRKGLIVLAVMLSISALLFSLSIPNGIQGVQGNQGIQGIQGLQGSQGLQGIQGNAGVDGRNGTDGLNGKDANITALYNLFEYNKTTILGDVDNNGIDELITVREYLDSDGYSINSKIFILNASDFYVFAQSPILDNAKINALCMGQVLVGGFYSTAIIAGGALFDGVRWSAFVDVWDDNLNIQRTTGWYWGNDTFVNAVAFDWTTKDIISAGTQYDGTRFNSQVITWYNDLSSPVKLQGWFWNGDTYVSGVTLVNDELITKGYFYSFGRWNGQIIIWNNTNNPISVISIMSFNANPMEMVDDD